MTQNSKQEESGEEFEAWLDRQLTGDLATGSSDTELRMAVSTIKGMPNIPKDYAVQPLKRFINSEIRSVLAEVKLTLVEREDGSIVPRYELDAELFKSLEEKYQ